MRKKGSVSLGLVALVAYSQAFYALWRRGQLGYLAIDQGINDEDPLLFMIRFALFLGCLVSAVVFILRQKHPQGFAHAVRFPLAVIVVSFLSAIWSVDPIETLRRSLVLVATFLTSLGLLSLGENRVRKALLLFTALICIASLVTALFLPAYGVSQGIHAGSWRGVFVHKNALGSSVLFGLVVVLSEILSKRRIPKRLVVLFLLDLTLVGLSNSRTAMLASAFLIVVALLFKIRQSRVRATISILAIWVFMALAVVVLYVVTADPFSTENFMRANLNLSGRSILWQESLRLLLRQRPILGYGYGAFWDFAGEEYSRYFSWLPSQAHSGYMDILLSFGSAGLIAFSFASIALFINSLRRALSNPSEWQSVFTFVFISALLVHMLTESVFQASWTIWTLIAFLVCNRMFMVRDSVIQPVPHSQSAKPWRKYARSRMACV